MSNDESRQSEQEQPDEHSRTDISIHQQAIFGTEGLEIETDAVETTLADHGIEPGRRRTTRLDVPGSEAFVDDRPRVNDRKEDAGEQGSLFPSTDPGQRTIDGRDARMSPLFSGQSEREPSSDRTRS
jgi:hypothetical protein